MLQIQTAQPFQQPSQMRLMAMWVGFCRPARTRDRQPTGAQVQVTGSRGGVYFRGSCCTSWLSISAEQSSCVAVCSVAQMDSHARWWVALSSGCVAVCSVAQGVGMSCLHSSQCLPSHTQCTSSSSSHCVLSSFVVQFEARLSHEHQDMQTVGSFADKKRSQQRFEHSVVQKKTHTHTHTQQKQTRPDTSVFPETKPSSRIVPG